MTAISDFQLAFQIPRNHLHCFLAAAHPDDPAAMLGG
jgi:hypothetical protein